MTSENRYIRHAVLPFRKLFPFTTFHHQVGKGHCAPSVPLRCLWLLSIVLTMVLNFGAPGVAASAVSADSMTYFFTFEIGLTEAERSHILREYDVELIRWLPELNVAEVRVSHDGDASPGVEPTARRSLASSRPQSPKVRIEPNGFVYGTTIPNDPAVQQGGESYAHEKLQLAEAWDYETGEGTVVVAILDTGIDYDHPELAGQIVPGYDFVHQRADASDDNGHGTHIAGIVAAQMNNGLGSAGVCPGCRIMPVKVLDASNIGVWSEIVQGIVFAADNGANIINLSLGSSEESDAVQRAITYAQSKGVLVVAAAGNSRSEELFYPAAYADVLSVVATDEHDRIWALSNYGQYIDVAAPGYLVYSSNIGNEQFSFMTGTSMAAPFVAGLAGLLLSQDPSRTPAAVSELILESADDLGEPGWDPVFGFGRINAHDALVELQGASETPSTHMTRPLTIQVYAPLFANQD